MPSPPDVVPLTDARDRAPGNSFGILEAVCGFLGGEIVASLALTAYEAMNGHHKSGIGVDVVGFVFLWAGLAGAAVVGTRWHAPAAVARRPPLGSGPPAVGTGSLVADYGLELRLWPDVPLGIAVGVGSQYVLVPALDLVLQPFVHHLNQRIGGVADNLLGSVTGTALVVLAILVCVGSPLVEELFFRGLLLRGLLGRLVPLGRRIGPVLSLLLTGLVFALAHFEALQFLGLAGFGVVLSYLAYRTGRLGPNIVAHVAFNTTTVVAYVVSLH
ncbi:MAG: lysostaphin resistance A-like protein [Acidimicrobiales bacterium]